MLRKLLLIVMAMALLGGTLLAAQDTAQPAAPAGPRARTQEEFADYTSANSVTGGAEREKAAHHFAQKHPKSELRAYLYSETLREYVNENNSGKVLEVGEKVLSLDASNAVALVLTATALADGMSDNEKDKEREKKAAQIRDHCARASHVLESGYTIPGASPAQINAYVGMLTSMNHSALGILELKLGHDADAEKELRAATQTPEAQPDPYVWYHLALALDHQNKYKEALGAVNSALQYAGSNADLEKLAQGERERLSRLTAPGASTPPAAAPGNPK
jgi:tetratricopeptide (TPR) repeat protein